MIWAWYKHQWPFNFIIKENNIVVSCLKLLNNDSFIFYFNDYCDQARITFRAFHISNIKSPLR